LAKTRTLFRKQSSSKSEIPKEQKNVAEEEGDSPIKIQQNKNTRGQKIENATHAWASQKCQKTSFFDEKSHDLSAADLNDLHWDLMPFSSKRHVFHHKFTVSRSILEGELLSRWELEAEWLKYKFR
jgi:hypothetical protein